MMPNLLVDVLCKLAKIAFICVLSRVFRQSNISPRALSARVISVCKKRLAPHQILVIKDSSKTSFYKNY